MFRWKCAFGAVCGMALSQAHAGLIEQLNPQASANPSATIAMEKMDIRSMAPSSLTLKTQVTIPVADSAIDRFHAITSRVTFHDTSIELGLRNVNLVQQLRIDSAAVRQEALLATTETAAITRLGNAEPEAKQPVNEVRMVSPASSGVSYYTIFILVPS